MFVVGGMSKYRNQRILLKDELKVKRDSSVVSHSVANVNETKKCGRGELVCGTIKKGVISKSKCSVAGS